MEEIKNEFKNVVIGTNTLAITKGYGYVNKEGKQRYSYNEVYFKDDDGNIMRQHKTDRGVSFYNVELIDLVIEEFTNKDGREVSISYPLSECPYLAESYETVDLKVLENFLSFKLHR